MRIQRRKLLALFIPTIVIVVIDQLSKYWVRTTPSLHNYDVIDGVLAFHYTQNPGMALGMRWADTPVISVIAIIATLFIMVYIVSSLPRAKQMYLVCMGLILGGAFGNIIDRLFMARIENYGTFLEGHVVDFIHFTLQINDFAVFPYIFNVADMAISTSLILLLVFHNRLLPGYRYVEKKRKDEKQSGEEESPGTNVSADNEWDGAHESTSTDDRDANEHDVNDGGGSSAEGEKEDSISQRDENRNKG